MQISMGIRKATRNGLKYKNPKHPSQKIILNHLVPKYNKDFQLEIAIKMVSSFNGLLKKL